MNKPKLFMLLLGCCPKGRHTEQHDVFFGIADNLFSLVPSINSFWPEANGNIHIDAWRNVTAVNGYHIEICTAGVYADHAEKLFFINLGGYAKDVFDEAHHKMLVIGTSKAEAILQAKQSLFYKSMGFDGATSHIDDKYGVDVDEVFEIEDVLSKETRANYRLKIGKKNDGVEDEIHLGYLPLKNLRD